jgi:hypothetical protein
VTANCSSTQSSSASSDWDASPVKLRLLAASGLLCWAVALLAANYQGLGDVLSIWFSGRQTSGSTLWGLSMVWCGRIGKLMQFVAGFVVVLDLIGPNRLRAIGERATGQLRDFHAGIILGHEQNVLAELKKHIREQIIRDSYSTNPAIGWSHWRFLVYEAKHPLPDQPWFSQAMVDDLRTEIIGELDTRHTCGTPHQGQVCAKQAEYADERVNRFMRDGLPPRERELLEQWNNVQRQEDTGPISMVMAIFFVCTLGLALVLAVIAKDLPAGIQVAMAVVSFMLSIKVLLRVVTDMTLPLGLRLRAMFVGPVMRFTAKILDHSAPGHQLRRWGFYFFFVGFILDLLAS